jgi:hypothetical protein
MKTCLHCKYFNATHKLCMHTFMTKARFLCVYGYTKACKNFYSGVKNEI